MVSYVTYDPLLQEQLVQAKDRELGHAQQQLRQQVAIMSDIIAYVVYTYSPLLGGCYVYTGTINQLPTQAGAKV